MLLSLFMAHAAPIRSRARRGLAYGPRAGQKLEAFAPVGADGEAPVAIVLSPGRGVAARILARMLSSRGIVALVPAVSAEPDMALRDAAAACAWARGGAGRLGGDGRRLSVLGHQEGAGLAALLALEPRWLAEAGCAPVSGAIGVFGVYRTAGLDAAHARPCARPLLLVEDLHRPDFDSAPGPGPLARALRTVGGQVTEIRCPDLERAPLWDLTGALQRRLIALDEVERFIRLGGLESATAA